MPHTRPARPAAPPARGGLALSAMLAAACASGPAPRPAAGPATAALREGHAYYLMLTPDPEPGMVAPGATVAGDEYVAAYASPTNAPPVYPRAALEAGCGRGLVVLRVRLGKDGRVVRIQDSPLAARTQGPCAELFRSAAEQTLRGWHFAPARRQFRVAGLDLDHDGVADLPRWDSEALEAETDIQFRFEVELRPAGPSATH